MALEREKTVEARLSEANAAPVDSELTPFQRLVRTRRSVRRFLERPVERDKLLTCVEAARLAPSAENVEPWRFVILDDPELKQRFAEAAFSGIYRPTRWAAKAPVLVAILARPDIFANRIGKQIQGTNYYLIDIGIAGEHFVLQAHELGLGTCWIGWFHEKKARKTLGLSRKYKVVSLLAVGYPEPREPKPKKRRALEEIAFFNDVPK